MEMDLLFVDGVLLVALMSFLASLGHLVGRICGGRFPALRRVTARFERHHPVLCDRDDNFYCFFRRDAFQLS